MFTRFFFHRFAFLLAVSVLALAPSRLVFAQGLSPTILTPDMLDKYEAVCKSTKDDPAARAEIEGMVRDQAVVAALVHGGSVNGTVQSTYPTMAAAMKAAGLTPDEYFRFWGALMTAVATARTSGQGTVLVPQANVDFVKANQVRIDNLRR